MFERIISFIQFAWGVFGIIFQPVKKKIRRRKNKIKTFFIYLGAGLYLGLSLVRGKARSLFLPKNIPHCE